MDGFLCVINVIRAFFLRGLFVLYPQCLRHDEFVPLGHHVPVPICVYMNRRGTVKF